MNGYSTDEEDIASIHPNLQIGVRDVCMKLQLRARRSWPVKLCFVGCNLEGGAGHAPSTAALRVLAMSCAPLDLSIHGQLSTRKDKIAASKYFQQDKWSVGWALDYKKVHHLLHEVEKSQTMILKGWKQPESYPDNRLRLPPGYLSAEASW